MKMATLDNRLLAQMKKTSVERTGFPDGSVGKECAWMQETQETQVQSLSREDPLKEQMAAHSSILAWKIPWTEEPSGL